MIDPSLKNNNPGILLVYCAHWFLLLCNPPPQHTLQEKKNLPQPKYCIFSSHNIHEVLWSLAAKRKTSLIPLLGNLKKKLKKNGTLSLKSITPSRLCSIHFSCLYFTIPYGVDIIWDTTFSLWNLVDTIPRGNLLKIQIWRLAATVSEYYTTHASCIITSVLF